MTIQDAKLFLEEQGYYTETLWSIDDVSNEMELVRKEI